MRIIDKNTDFYDFYQGIYRDDTITFDRTDSFLLTKELMCKYLLNQPMWFFEDKFRYSFILLQVCNAFWLFLFEITEWKESNGFKSVSDYTVELITKWKNYNKSRILISLDIIRFNWSVDIVFRRRRFPRDEYEKKKFFEKADVLIQAVDTGNYEVQYSIDSYKIYRGGQEEEKHIPLLKACGVANCVDPLEIYLAFEEYFSLEKSSRERTESNGLTDKDRISNHGFDVKTSFRGKQ